MKKAIAATTIMVWQPVPSNIDGLNAASGQAFLRFGSYMVRTVLMKWEPLLTKASCNVALIYKIDVCQLIHDFRITG